MTLALPIMQSILAGLPMMASPGHSQTTSESSLHPITEPLTVRKIAFATCKRGGESRDDRLPPRQKATSSQSFKKTRPAVRFPKLSYRCSFLCLCKRLLVVRRFVHKVRSLFFQLLYDVGIFATVVVVLLDPVLVHLCEACHQGSTVGVRRHCCRARMLRRSCRRAAALRVFGPLLLQLNFEEPNLRLGRDGVVDCVARPLQPGPCSQSQRFT